MSQPPSCNFQYLGAFIPFDTFFKSGVISEKKESWIVESKFRFWEKGWHSSLWASSELGLSILIFWSFPLGIYGWWDFSPNLGSSLLLRHDFEKEWAETWRQDSSSFVSPYHIFFLLIICWQLNSHKVLTYETCTWLLRNRLDLKSQTPKSPKICSGCILKTAFQLGVIFKDLEKAFDRICRDLLT